MGRGDFHVEAIVKQHPSVLAQTFKETMNRKSGR